MVYGFDKQTEIATATEVKVDNTIAWSTLDSSFVPFRYHILHKISLLLRFKITTLTLFTRKWTRE